MAIPFLNLLQGQTVNLSVTAGERDLLSGGGSIYFSPSSVDPKVELCVGERWSMLVNKEDRYFVFGNDEELIVLITPPDTGIEIEIARKHPEPDLWGTEAK